VRAFIDQYRHAYGVEPICRVMQVAPSGYWRYAAQQRNPSLRCARVQRDDVLSVDIERIWQANLQVRTPGRSRHRAVCGKQGRQLR
jgi:hypothetical protein